MAVQKLPAKIPALIGLFFIACLIIAGPPTVKAETVTGSRSLIIGSDEVVVWFPVAGSFTLSDYDVRLVIPEQWRDSVVLNEMHVVHEEGVLVVYGLLFYPRDVEVSAVQYLGALMVYDRKLWRPGDTEHMLTLAETDDCVFVFLNSLLSLYEGLPESALFDGLALSDAEAAELLKIENCATP